MFGAGIVGQFAAASAYKLGAARVIVVDGEETRLAAALAQHCEVVDYNREDPVQAIMDLTNGIGADAVIDAVGVDAERRSAARPPCRTTRPPPSMPRCSRSPGRRTRRLR